MCDYIKCLKIDDIQNAVNKLKKLNCKLVENNYILYHQQIKYTE